MLDRLAAITTFVAVADHHGFAAAARRLGLTPSAVTRLVAALEERLGIRLLQRTTRSVALTDAGARYLERARRILADLEEADDSAKAERTVPTGRFAVSAPMAFGRLNVAPLMGAFLTRHPGLIGELTLSDRMVNLVEDGIDLAVRIGHLSDSSLIARRLGATRRVVVASTAYLERRGSPADPAEIANHDIVQFASVGGPAEWRFLRDGVEQRYPVRPRYTTNSAEAAILNALEYGGLTRVLAYQAAALLAAGRMRIVLAGFEPEPLPIQLVYPTSRLVSAKVRAFIDLALEMSDWQFTEF